MARQVRDKLSPRFVDTVKASGKYGDGKGLWLIVDKNGSKRWRFIFALNGKRHEMGLGGFPEVGLSDARSIREESRAELKAGINPILARREREAQKAAKEHTFGAFSDSIVDFLASEFRNEKHIAQWKNTLKTYAAPIRNKGLDEITTDDILGILQPIWLSKTETASRVRGRIERVLDAAKAKGLRTGENPARWRGHLDTLLPKRQKLTRGHHAAMPFEDVPKFVVSLIERDAVAARALEFLILTAARSGEVMGATWDEIALDAKVWTIPAQRMKAGRTHRVPLSDRAMKILENMKAIRVSDYVFPGTKKGRPLSIMAMTMLLRRMDADNATVHGFRSSFRDWAGEMTNHPREVAEAALAHTIGDATERAYRRGDALERRRRLMDAWAIYLTAENRGNIVVLPHTGEIRK